MDESEIQQLVRMAQEGNETGFTRLFELFSDRIFRYLRFRVADIETAEDLTQTVFLEMIQSLERYQPRKTAKFSTWLFQIARFRLIDHYRKHTATVSVESVSAANDEQLTTDPPELLAPDIMAVLRTLPEKYQTVLHLRFIEDLDAAEVAEILKTTSVNVRVMQHRGLTELRKRLGHNE